MTSSSPAGREPRPEPTEWERLRRGEVVNIGGKLMVICQQCRSLIRIDKPIFGSLHVCQ